MPADHLKIAIQVHQRSVKGDSIPGDETIIALADGKPFEAEFPVKTGRPDRRLHRGMIYKTKFDQNMLKVIELLFIPDALQDFLQDHRKHQYLVIILDV